MNLHHMKCKKTDVSLSTYTGEGLMMPGKAKVRVDQDSRRVTLPVSSARGRNIDACFGRRKLA